MLKLAAVAMSVLMTGVPVMACEISTSFSPKEKTAVMIGEQLDKVEDSIKCSLYSLTHKDLTAKLVEAHKRGKLVLLGIDGGMSKRYPYGKLELAKAGVLFYLKKSSTPEHNKYCILDNRSVIVGSFNWSESAPTQDNSTVLLKNCPQTTQDFLADFDRIIMRDMGRPETVVVKKPS